MAERGDSHGDRRCRAVWSLQEHPAEAGRFLWLNARNNLGASPMGLAFRIDGQPGKIVWDPEPVALKADDFRPVHRPLTKVANAAAWLSDYLRPGNAPDRSVRGLFDGRGRAAL